MTTKKARPTISELQAQLEAANAALAAKEKENEALQARIPTPKQGKKMGNHEPFKQGKESAKHNGANGIPVTYQEGSLDGLTAEILELAFKVFGENEFTTNDLKQIMFDNMMSAGGGRRYCDLRSANTGAQRLRNAVYTGKGKERMVVPGFPFTVPFTLREVGKGLIWKLDSAGVTEILEHAKS